MIGGGERASFFFVFGFCFLSFVFLGMFWLDSMLTARSECHVSREAAVIRSGNGTLHFWGGGGRGGEGYRFETKLRASQHASRNADTLIIIQRKATPLLVHYYFMDR